MAEQVAAVMISCTCADAAEADRIARQLVEQRFAACVHALPIRSTYRWQGAVEQADEMLLLVKTARDRAEEAVRSIKAAHSYEVPEILVFSAAGGWPPYLQWLAEETYPPSPGRH